ncbi:MAG: asparagine N-glycosylation enzyme membrane subunit Stt3, partial [Candidatus Woesearchaeota archaeon]
SEIIKYKSVRSMSTIHKEIYVAIAYLISSVIFTKLLAGTFILKNIWGGVFNVRTNIVSFSAGNIWPNVLSSVAELNPASFTDIIAQSGGQFVIAIALLGVTMAALQFKSKNTTIAIAKAATAVLGLFWFALLTVPPAKAAGKIVQPMINALTTNTSFLFLVILFIPVGVALILAVLNGSINRYTFVSMLLSMWIAETIYMSLNGVRFILFLAPAIGLAFALGVYFAVKSVTLWLLKVLDIAHTQKESEGINAVMAIVGITGILIGLIASKTWFIFWTFVLIAIAIVLFFALRKPLKIHTAKSVASVTLATTGIGIIVLLLVMGSPLDSTFTTSEQVYPNFDDTWVASMNKIADNSTPDAIITSWWDFGHFFIAASGRGATFDGASQTSPQSHWVGKLLLENNENVSLDILRMSNCGGDQAFDRLLEVTEDTTGGVVVNQILYDTFGVEDKQTVLIEAGLTQEQADYVLEKLACSNPPQNYVIASGDMIGKAPVWSHWGSWSFEKKYVLSNFKEQSVSEMAQSLQLNESIIQQYVNDLNAINLKSRTANQRETDLRNQWLAPYPGYIQTPGGYVVACETQNTTIGCQNGVIVDGQTGAVTSQNPQIKIRRLLFPESGTKITEFPADPTGNIDAVLIPTANGYQMLLAAYPLGNSLFTKMYFLDGIGLTKFTKFDDRRSITGVRITTWATNWE